MQYLQKKNREEELKHLKLAIDADWAYGGTEEDHAQVKKLEQIVETRKKERLEEERQDKQRQEIADQDQMEEYATIGGSALVSTIAMGTLLVGYRRRKKKVKETKELEITKIYPNPSNGIFFLEYTLASELPGAELIISDSTGKIAGNFSIKNALGAKKISLFRNGPGIYFATIVHNGVTSSSKKIVIVSQASCDPQKSLLVLDNIFLKKKNHSN